MSRHHRACSPAYPKYPLISQQLLTIQEELNNKKSELEQAKEEQSHTQALLKVLQEQVRELSSTAVRTSVARGAWPPAPDARVTGVNLPSPLAALPWGIYSLVPSTPSHAEVPIETAHARR